MADVIPRDDSLRLGGAAHMQKGAVSIVTPSRCRLSAWRMSRTGGIASSRMAHLGQRLRTVRA
jgi:hypothetical protein